MTMPRPTPRVPDRLMGCLVAALLLTLSACSGSPGADEPDTTGATGTTETPVGDVGAFWDSVLAGHPLADAVTQHTQMEEDIAACMTALGFEYTPIDFDSVVDVTTAADLGLEQGTREFAAQFGYGISTDVMGYYAMTAQTAADPNAEYVASLSEAARAQYDLALYGSVVPGSDPSTVPPEEMGCQGLAVEHSQAGPRATDAFDPAALRADEDTMRATARNDERVAESRGEWTACMADAGFPDMLDPGDGILTGTPVTTLMAEFSDLMIAAQTDLPVADTMDAASAQASLAALAVKDQLAEREIEMALADFDCRAQTGYAVMLATVEAEYEAEFFEAHRTEYEAYAEAYAEIWAARDSEG